MDIGNYSQVVDEDRQCEYEISGEEEHVCGTCKMWRAGLNDTSGFCVRYNVSQHEDGTLWMAPARPDNNNPAPLPQERASVCYAWEAGETYNVQPEQVAQTATGAVSSPVGVFAVALVAVEMVGILVLKAVARIGR